MEARTRSLAGRAALIGCVFALASCGALGLLGAPPSLAARAERLARAEDRWNARAPAHYRLVMQAPAWCRLDIEIKDERIVHTFQNTCPESARTVTGLFDLIRQLDSDSLTLRCAPDGCECTETLSIQAVYDDTLGAPREIRLRRQRAPNWPELWYYVRQRGLPLCLTPPDMNLVTVLALNPLS
jgi:hypothetical protein